MGDAPGGRRVGAAGTGGKSWLQEGKADTFPGKCLRAPGWGALNARIRGGYRVRALPYESQGAQLDDNVLLSILPISFALPWLLHPVLPAMWRCPRPDLLIKRTNLFFLFFCQKTSGPDFLPHAPRYLSSSLKAVKPAPIGIFPIRPFPVAGRPAVPPEERGLAWE